MATSVHCDRFENSCFACEALINPPCKVQIPLMHYTIGTLPPLYFPTSIWTGYRYTPMTETSKHCQNRTILISFVDSTISVLKPVDFFYLHTVCCVNFGHTK